MKIYEKNWPKDIGPHARPWYLIDGPNHVRWDMNIRNDARVIFFETHHSVPGGKRRWVAAKWRGRRGWWLCEKWESDDDVCWHRTTEPIPSIGPLNSRMEAYLISRILNE
jgi:hypothetical protein